MAIPMCCATTTKGNGAGGDAIVQTARQSSIGLQITPYFDSSEYGDYCSFSFNECII